MNPVLTMGPRPWAFLALVIFVTGCATAPVKRDPPVSFPPPPELPRVQYLTSLSGLKSVEEQSAFNRFVVGEQPDLKLSKPYGVAMYDGKIYVCDTNATVAVFDLKHKKFSTLKGADGPGRLAQPINVSVGPDGTKYVADPVRGQVVAFDRNDEYLRAYGALDKWRPVDAVPFGDRLYVADPGTGTIRVFDRESAKLILTFGDKGEPTQRLDRPTNLAVDGAGNLYVTDASRFDVVKFDADGKFKQAFGGPGDNRGRFARPKGIAVDREGRLYVTDASFGNVQVFNRDGRLLMFFGEGGDKPGGFLLPAKVAIDYDNIQYFEKLAEPNFQIEYVLLVTSQFGNRLVNVLAFGKEKGKQYPTDDELLRAIDERRKAVR